MDDFMAINQPDIASEELPLMPIEGAPEETPFDTHLMNLDIIEQALQSVKGAPALGDILPEYYDDMLLKLIDAVPLE